MNDDMKPMIEAVLAASSSIPSLTKDEENSSGPRSFSYVSIDSFYEQVGPIARNHGLTWKARETKAQLVELHGRNGLASALFATYEFDMLHASGLVWENYHRISIVHPMQGAQTAGSAMSYAEKQFMREVFKIATGEGDADASDPNVFSRSHAVTSSDPFAMDDSPVQAGAAPIANAVASEDPFEVDAPTLPPPPDSTESMVVVVDKFLQLVTSETHLTEFWTRNKVELDRLKAESPQDYAKVVAAFAAKKKTF